mmetsp:Transcript_5358/g.5902  ORF Transcript_5358/g.5902 Transcript_5358/m.5902 type:complete len:225 (+) Transcript_5358:105-779(+)
MSSKPTIGYWNIRGLAAPLRMAMHYTGTDFEDKTYQCGPAPDFDRSAWNNEKHNLGLTYPNLPYYIEGDFKLTQSMPILTYICEKFGQGLLGDNPEERSLIAQVASEFSDYKGALTRICYNSEGKKLVAEGAFDAIVAKLGNTEKFLGANEFMVGNKVTYVDFFVWEQLDQLESILPGTLDKYPQLKGYHQRFRNLPQLESYFKLETKPFNNTSAAIGATVESN